MTVKLAFVNQALSIIFLKMDQRILEIVLLRANKDKNHSEVNKKLALMFKEFYFLQLLMLLMHSPPSPQKKKRASNKEE